MPIIDTHHMEPAPPALSGIPTEIECPDDDAEAAAADIVRVASTLLGTAAYLQGRIAANDSDKITGNGAPPAGGYTPTTRAIEIKGTGLKMSAPLEMNQTQPSATSDPGSNQAYGTNMEKAWANITTDGAGSYTLNDGFNVASCTITSTYAEVTWARAFANANYAPTVTCNGSGVDVIIANINFASQTTAKTRIFFTQLWGGVSAIDPTALGFTFAIRVGGRH